MAIWLFFPQFFTITNTAAINIYIQVFVWRDIFISLG